MADVTFTANLQPAPACYPPDTNALLTLIAGGGLSGTIPDNAGGGVFVGTIAPADPLTNKVWFKVDVAGRPLGVYLHYNGRWRRMYTGLSIGEMRMFWYSPANFDGTGRGIVESEMDGWALCNGQNGTPNLEDSRFPAGGSWNGSSWVIWDPNTGAAQSTGGQGIAGHTLTAGDLPALHVTPHIVREGTLVAGNPGPYVGGPNDPAATAWPVQDAGGNNTGINQKPLPLPTYFAIGFLMFVGYQ